jgi:hypothetical protein
MIRYEYKYFLNFKQYQWLYEKINFCLPRDRYSLDGRYPVLSKYYDTPNLELYFQKRNGERRHIKIRMRQYTDFWEETAQTWLECKYKLGDQQEKIRINIDRETDIAAFADQFLGGKLWSPTLEVYFEREAYESLIEGHKLRLTFDSAISPRSWGKLGVEDGRKLNDRVLLEIKYGHPELPIFIRKWIQEAAIERTSFSKYAFSVDNWLHCQPWADLSLG